MNKIILVLLFLVGTSYSFALDIKVRGLKPRSNKGIYRCLIFNKEDGFPGTAKNAIQAIDGKIINNEGLCLFTNLNPGIYAVSTFHDENSNAKLDTNFLGIPKEDYGFSKNASQPFGPPSFKEAAFEAVKDTVLNINLN